MDFRDAGGPIRGDLLADRQVQAHVQEGVFFAPLGGEFGPDSPFAGLQPCDIFRVLGDDRGELSFQRLEGRPGAVFAPRLEVHAAHLIAILAGKEWHVAKPIAIPVARPVRQTVASAPAAASTALDAEQPGLDATTKPAALYTEGDLTVADFDATDGTLQASDGRIFVLGTTIAASYAASWDSYHSLVHYRCDQSGSCVLMRAGAVAPNARLI